MNVIENVKEAILRQKLLRKGDRVVIGVSGGPDSIFLLHVFFVLRYELGISLHVAHLNHGLRKESITDQRFVEKICSQLNIPSTVFRLEKGILKKEKGSLEAVARDYRIKFFVRVAQKQHAQVVALGHNQNDLAETILMRIIRGSGLLGIRGILPQKKIVGVNFIRPLLNIFREDIERFLHKEKISYRIDVTNKSHRFFRNQIRWELVPFLEKHYNKSIQKNLASLSDILAQDYNYLEIEAKRSLFKILHSESARRIKLKILPFRNLHRALQRMILRQCFENLHGDLHQLNFVHLFEIEDLIQNRPLGSIVNIPGKIKVLTEAKYLIILKEK